MNENGLNLCVERKKNAKNKQSADCEKSTHKHTHRDDFIGCCSEHE